MTEPSFLSATRASYDTVAAEYAERVGNYLPEQPLDRAMIGAFADFARTAAAGPVADLGCGHAISLDVQRLPPEQVVESLGQAGLFVHARTVLEPDGITDKLQRIYLLARKPAEV